MRRYVRVSTAMGGLAARLAGRALSRHRADRPRHAADLKAALGGIKGPLMKVAQLLATIPNALPQEYADELATLQANAPPMGWNFVKRRMAGELGPDWERKFRSFEHEAARAASLGQVHRAVGTGRAAARLQAAISRHGVRGRGRPAAAQTRAVALRALRPRRRHRRDPCRGRRPAARGARLRARGRAPAALSPHARRTSRRSRCRSRCRSFRRSACSP